MRPSLPEAVVHDASGLLALDVGGANLKAADGRGFTHAESLPLWRDPAALADRIGALVARRRPARVVATMTGEIADCFASRREGVAAIVTAVEDAARTGGCASQVLLVDGSLVAPAAARERWEEAAAANWHVLARLAAAHAPAWPALLIDVGSTTTDIVPLADGRPAPAARDDHGRLAAGELVYTGVERTPLAALVRAVRRDGVWQPVVAERYAESRDVWVWSGELVEDPASTDTADGRPLTREASRARLARMLLEEPDRFDAADAERFARRCADAQTRLVARGVTRVASRLGGLPAAVVLSGHGEFLARRALDRVGWQGPLVSLGARLGSAIARVAPAHALALVALGELR